MGIRLVKHNHLKSGCLLVIGLALAGCGRSAPDAAPLPVEIAPDDPRISITGRFDARDPAGPRLSWSGAKITVRFHGGTLNALLHDAAPGHRHDVRGYESNYLNVTIDGGVPTVLAMHPGEHLYRVADGLPDGEHTVELFKRTEGKIGTVQLRGMQLSGSGQLLDPPPRPTRRIEFIGDSITAGFGNEAARSEDNFAPETENNALTYAALTAEALDAEYSCIAISGRGLARNYNGTTSGVMPRQFPLALADDEDSAWDFGQWTPDVVVINLGTNDMYAKPPPAREEFLGAYLALLQSVRAVYPDAHVFCAVGPMVGQDQPSHLTDSRQYTQAVVDSARDSGDDKVYYIEFPMNTPADGFGANEHPSLATHRRMAEQLTAAIRNVTGW